MGTAATGILAASLLLTSVLALPSRRLRSDNALATDNFVGDGTNELATAILQGYVDSEENLAFSPLGFSVLLAILKEGARGETRNQLVNAMHLPEDPAVTRAAYKSVLERFREKNLENHPEFRNWFYIYKNFTVDPEYRMILQENYLTEVKDVDRLDKEAVKEEAESMKNTENAENTYPTTQSPDSMSEDSDDLEKLEESAAPANVEEIVDPEKGDKTQESEETEEIMQLSDEDASNSNKNGPLKFSIPIPFPEKLKLRKMHDEREASPSGEVMTMQEEMLGNKDEKVEEIKNDKMEDEKKEEMMQEIKNDKTEGEKKEVVMEVGNKDEKTEEIKDDKMEDEKKGEKMDDGKKKEIIKEIIDEMKSLRDKLQAGSNEEKDKKEKNEEPSKDDVTTEEMKDDKMEEIKDDKMEEIKDDKMEEIKDEKKEEKEDKIEEIKGDKTEEKKDDKLEENKGDKIEEKRDDKTEEIKDDKIEEMKDEKMEEMKDDKLEEMKEDKKEEMKDDKMEKKKIDKIEEIKEDKMEEMKVDKMEAMKDDKKEEISKDEMKDCEMMGSKPEDMMDKMKEKEKEKESMMNDKKEEAVKENKDEKKDSMMENNDKDDQHLKPGFEEDMRVDLIKEEELISQTMKEDEAMKAEKRKGRHLELPRISRGTLQSHDVTSSLSGNNLVRKDTRSEAVSQMLVFNGLYFKGTWETPFIGQREDSFYKSDTEKSTVTMMNTQGNFRTGNIPDLDSVAIELPYKGKRYALMIVMPNSRTGLRQLAAEMTNYPLRDIQKHLQYQDVEVCIPSFEVESTTKPIQALNKFGVSDIFSKEQADLSGISKDSGLFVEELVQFVTVKVDDGSSSYNEMTASNPSSRSGLTKFAVDHPFLFFVRDTTDNVIVISGKVVDPSVLPKKL